MPDGCASILAGYRQRRAFNPRVYADAKAVLLNRYAKLHGIDAIVVGLSGGVDSSVVAALLKHASKQFGSPLRAVVGVTMPVYSEAASGQNESALLAATVAEQFGITFIEADLTGAWSATHAAVVPRLAAVGFESNSWAAGQLASTIRTPALYMTASVLVANSFRAVVAGTTNCSEGAYLGYVGKASDGMVDVQVISDIHKSEVIALARHFGVVGAVVDREPTGDMFDGVTDVHVFGAPYDAVELHFAYRRGEVAARDVEQLPLCDRELLDVWFSNIEELHLHNRHKYFVGSPAVHLDLYDSSMPDGAQDRRPSRRVVRQDVGSPDRFHGWVPIPDDEVLLLAEHRVRKVEIEAVDGEVVLVVRGALSDAEVVSLRSFIATTAPDAGVAANAAGFTADAGQPVGSLRSTFWMERVAAVLSERVLPFLPDWYLDNDDGELPEDVWRPAAVTALGRLVRYPPGGLLWAHCDSPYWLSSELRTTHSLVLNVVGGVGGAETVFAYRPSTADLETRHTDWGRLVADREVAGKVVLSPGDVALFPHRLVHSSRVTGDVEKWSLRMDVVAERWALPGEAQ
jgi:NAD+ synthase (glutamine-hydrolysing)